MCHNRFPCVWWKRMAVVICEHPYVLFFFLLGDNHPTLVLGEGILGCYAFVVFLVWSALLLS